MVAHLGQGSRYHLARDTLQRVAPKLPSTQPHVVVSAQKRVTRSGSPLSRSNVPYIEVLDEHDLWRVDTAVEMLRNGKVGIIPTDTFPAVVCDLEHRDAVQRLYAIQNLRPTKLLSIIVRNLKDVSTYTLGFAVSNAPGQVAGFTLAKRLLPGPYTLILTASKCMPKQCLDFSSRKSKPRKTVGIRMPDDPVCRAITAQLDRPLLCSSVHTEDDVVVDDSSVMLPDPALLFDAYVGRGIDFMVSDGRASWTAGSTIVDMTTAEPSVLRQGQGSVDMFS